MKSMRSHWIKNVAKSWRHRKFVRHRETERYPRIRNELSIALRDSVMLVGNSHAEFLGTPDFNGRPSLNLGIGGSTAIDCATHLASLRPSIRCAASVLIIGTNDIMRWRYPKRTCTEQRFEAEVRRILQILETWSAQVFVAAIPPIGAWATSRDPDCIDTFTARLELLCAEGGHTFFDPFADLRDGGSGLATTGLHRDGVHMANYTQLAEVVVGLVAPRLVLTQASTPSEPTPFSVRIDHSRRAQDQPCSAAVRAVGRPHMPYASHGFRA